VCKQPQIELKFKIKITIIIKIRNWFLYASGGREGRVWLDSIGIRVKVKVGVRVRHLEGARGESGLVQSRLDVFPSRFDNLFNIRVKVRVKDGVKVRVRARVRIRVRG